MKFITVAVLTGLFSITVPGIASAQSFNIDIGQPGAVNAPADSYAAAGVAGHWLSLPATQSVTVFNLADITGAVTGVSMNQIGGTETLLTNDPALSGDDAVLMNDYIITHTTTENCLFMYGMQPGQYEILIYGRMPAQPSVIGRDHVDQEPGTPYTNVGGVWPGHHQLGISFSRHLATVSGNGNLVAHAGVLPGGNYTTGVAMNGVQIRRLLPGDATGDGHVNIDDLLSVINHWGACPTGLSCPPDLTGDGNVNIDDLLSVINHWSP